MTREESRAFRKHLYLLWALVVAIIGIVMYLFKEEPYIEAHDLWYGDRWVSPEEHERMMEI